MELNDTAMYLGKGASGPGNWTKIITPGTATQQSGEQGNQPQPTQNHAEQTSQTKQSDDKSVQVQPDYMQQLTDFELMFVEINNMRVACHDLSCGVQTTLDIHSTTADDIALGIWFGVGPDIATEINQPQAKAAHKAKLEARLSQANLAELRDTSLQLTVSGLAPGTAGQLDLGLASLGFDPTTTNLKIDGLTAQTGARLKQPGDQTQKMQLRGNINLAQIRQPLDVVALQLDADLSIPQLGSSRQSLKLTGRQLDMALNSFELGAVQHDLDGKLTYSAMLTQPLVDNGDIRQQTANLSKTHLQLASANLHLAEVPSLKLQKTTFDASDNSLATSLGIPASNPRQAMGMVKINGQLISGNLSQTANQDVLSKLELSGDITTNLSPLKATVQNLKLLPDSPMLKGGLGTEGQASLYARVNLDTINLDDYLPPSAETNSDDSTDDQQSSTSDKSSTTIDPHELYSKAAILPLDLLQAYTTDIEIEIEIEIGSLQQAQQKFTCVEVKLQNNGKPISARAKADSFGGKANLTGSIKQLDATPGIELQPELEEIDLEQDQSMELENLLEFGHGNFYTNFACSGNSVYARVHSLDGPLELQVNKGKLLGINISREICSASGQTQSAETDLATTGPDTTSTRSNVKTDFAKGSMDTDYPDIAIPNLTVFAYGKIDLPSLEFDVPLRVEVAAKDLFDSCKLPASIGVSLVCKGKLFHNNPLSFCVLDLSSLKIVINNLLDEEKASEQQKKAKKQLQKELQGHF